MGSPSVGTGASDALVLADLAFLRFGCSASRGTAAGSDGWASLDLRALAGRLDGLASLGSAAGGSVGPGPSPLGVSVSFLPRPLRLDGLASLGSAWGVSVGSGPSALAVSVSFLPRPLGLDGLASLGSAAWVSVGYGPSPLAVSVSFLPRPLPPLPLPLPRPPRP